MFSIGLTVLSAAMLEDFEHLYDIKNYNFNQQQLNRKLDEFKVSGKYSDILKGAIANICEVNPDRRVSAEELWAFLQPHGHKIRGKEDFVVENAPGKLHQQVGELREAMPLLMKALGMVQPQLPQQLQQHQQLQQPQQPAYKLESSPPVVLHSRNTSNQREGLNFPPPIVKTTVPEKYSELYQKYNSPERNVPIQNSTQIESVYIPANQVPGFNSQSPTQFANEQ